MQIEKQIIIHHIVSIFHYIIFPAIATVYSYRIVFMWVNKNRQYYVGVHFIKWVHFPSIKSIQFCQWKSGTRYPPIYCWNKCYLLWKIAGSTVKLVKHSISKYWTVGSHSLNIEKYPVNQIYKKYKSQNIKSGLGFHWSHYTCLSVLTLARIRKTQYKDTIHVFHAIFPPGHRHNRYRL